MRILFIGDIVGRPGRKMVCDNLPGLIEEKAIDFTIANGENASGGFGLTERSGELSEDATEVLEDFVAIAQVRDRVHALRSGHNWSIEPRPPWLSDTTPSLNILLQLL